MITKIVKDKTPSYVGLIEGPAKVLMVVIVKADGSYDILRKFNSHEHKKIREFMEDAGKEHNLPLKG